MHWIKRVAAVVMAAALAITGVGYGLAWRTQSACGDDMFADIQRRAVSGTRLDGTPQALVRDDVWTRVASPFQVEVGYMVPRDLHGTHYRLRCSVGSFRHHLDLGAVEKWHSL
jgi:hypothetical protein